jgi:hypothetical protein
MHICALADDSVIRASRLSEVNSGKIDGLKWRKGEPFSGAIKFYSKSFTVVFKFLPFLDLNINKFWHRIPPTLH